MDDAIDEPQFKFNRGTMKFSAVFPKATDAPDAEISSWTNTANGTVNFKDITDSVYNNDHKDADVLPDVHFQIESTKIVSDENSKKYVVYVINIQRNPKKEDVYPTLIERRYTDFLELFSGLKLEYPNIMTQISFPRKLITGNFSEESISARSAAFESLLMFIQVNEKLKLSKSVTSFLQDKELKEAKHRISNGQHASAIPILESVFRLLNKLYTDRHPPVLRALCLLVACSHAVRSLDTEKYAGLALGRFQGVSDFDLLQYYVPLLQLCAQLNWTRANKDNDYKKIINERLTDMKRRGMKVDGCLPLLELLLQHDSQTETKQ